MIGRPVFVYFPDMTATSHAIEAVGCIIVAKLTIIKAINTLHDVNFAILFILVPVIELSVLIICQ